MVDWQKNTHGQSLPPEQNHFRARASAFHSRLRGDRGLARPPPLLSLKDPKAQGKRWSKWTLERSEYFSSKPAVFFQKALFLEKAVQQIHQPSLAASVMAWALAYRGSWEWGPLKSGRPPLACLTVHWVGRTGEGEVVWSRKGTPSYVDFGLALDSWWWTKFFPQWHVWGRSAYGCGEVWGRVLELLRVTQSQKWGHTLSDHRWSRVEGIRLIRSYCKKVPHSPCGTLRNGSHFDTRAIWLPKLYYWKSSKDYMRAFKEYYQLTYRYGCEKTHDMAWPDVVGLPSWIWEIIRMRVQAFEDF